MRWKIKWHSIILVTQIPILRLILSGCLYISTSIICVPSGLFYAPFNIIIAPKIKGLGIITQLIVIVYNTRSSTVSIAEPRTEIVGEKELYVDYASSLNLTCLVRSPNPPAYVFWKKEGKVS